MLMTFDENLKPLQVHVRMGTAINIISQAIQSKTTTGLQTAHPHQPWLVGRAYHQ
jgi:hypothetical protein